MKVCCRWLKDPFVELVAFALLALLVVGLRGRLPESQASSRPSGHPANCRACASIPPGAAAKFERYLVSHGYVEEPGSGY